MKDIIHNAQAIIYVVDSTRKDNLAMSAWELYVAGVIAQPQAPILVLINTKMSAHAIAFDQLFPLFSKESLPPRLYKTKTL